MSLGYQRLLASYLGASTGGLAPTLSLDLTASVPSQITFARTSTSKAIVGGTFTSLGTGTPAFESWGSVNRGLRVNGAATNQLTFSNVLTNAAWGTSNTTVSTGSDLGPDGATAMAFVAETTANNLHSVKQVITAVPAGTTQTFSCFARKPAGATRFAFGMRISVHFNNAGAQGVFRFDGTPMWFGIASDANVTNVVARMVDLGGGLYFCSLTGTVTSTGDMEYAIHSVWEGNTNGCLPNTTYTGVVTEGPEISSCQVSNTAGPASYCDNPTTAGANVAAESAIFNDISWLNTTVGTFVVEHDCIAGPVIGSGVNTIIGGQPLNPKTGAVKTAIAWDATGSDLVNNGGPTTNSGTPPTFGADIRLLSTSSTANFGHIKSIKYYNTRLSVAQIQALTAPTSTASPGGWRVASRCALPSHLDAASGTSNYFCVRVPANILVDMAKLRVDFANWSFPGTANTNAVVIDGCAWERTTGVAETVLFKFGGSQTKTLNAGDTNIVSDDMLPSQFTGLTKFPAGTQGWLRVYYHVPANLNTHPVSRWTAESNVTVWEWDNGVTSPDQPVTATGAITFTGAHIAATRGMAPVLIGVPSSGDPKTVFVAGDSRVEGVSGSGGTITGYTFIQKVCDNLNIPSLIFALGGTSQMSIYNTAFWKPYMAYARILIDEMGTNNSNQLIQFGDIWAAARTTYNIDRIVHTGFSPAATSTDNWATAANQTTEKTYPNTIELMLASCGQSGLLDVNQVFTTASIRDSGNVSKWNSNGTAFFYANDHIHQSLNGDNAMATELQPFINAVALT